MRNINIVWIGFLTILLTTNTYSLGACFIGFDADYSETKEETYTKKTCSAGYKALKKELKNTAKQICREEHDSPSWNIFRCKSFSKIKCEKIKRKGHKTKVIVKGAFSVYCK